MVYIISRDNTYYTEDTIIVLYYLHVAYRCILVVVHVGALNLKVSLMPAFEPFAELLEVPPHQDRFIRGTEGHDTTAAP